MRIYSIFMAITVLGAASQTVEASGVCISCTCPASASDLSTSPGCIQSIFDNFFHECEAASSPLCLCDITTTDSSTGLAYGFIAPGDSGCESPACCSQTAVDAGGAALADSTAAPTAAPSFEWRQESGCCREKVGKSMYNRHATVSDVQVFSQSTGYEADLNCTATCASDTTCTAIELTVKKGTARCEFHTSAINAATRGSKSCKKAQCKYKTAFMAPTAAPVPGPTPMVSPTSAPTAVPTPAPAWTEKKGCCRQVDGKIKYSHHDTATTTIISATLFSAAAVECKAQCNADANCTAAEVRQQRKKISTVFKCELHSDTINSSTRGSKSCKKATCSIKN